MAASGGSSSDPASRITASEAVLPHRFGGAEEAWECWRLHARIQRKIATALPASPVCSSSFRASLFSTPRFSPSRYV